MALAVPLACGSGQPASGPGGRRSVLNVSAASSLTEAFTTIKDRFEHVHPEVKVVLNFGASSELVQQLKAGSPTDVLATADDKTMKQATDGGLVDPPVTFARNRLAILVAAGNPKRIESLADLDSGKVTFVLCAPEVPCGRSGRQLLDKAGVKAEPKSLEPNVKAAVTRVTTGEVDAAIVYVTDAKAAASSSSAKAQGVAIPPNLNVTTAYPIAVAKATKRAAAAEEFTAYVNSPAARNVLTGDGFLPPS